MHQTANGKPAVCGSPQFLCEGNGGAGIHLRTTVFFRVTDTEEPQFPHTPHHLTRNAALTLPVIAIGHDLFGHQFHRPTREVRIGPVVPGVEQGAKSTDLIPKLV